jgi:hypothetical protein
MKNLNCFAAIVMAALLLTTFEVTARAQGGSQDARDFANISSAGSSVRFDVKVQHSEVSLTVAAPDGRVFRKEFKGSASPEFSITDEQGERLPDGHYSYELRVSPVISPSAKAALKESRGKDDEPEAVRSTRKRVMPVSAVQSGSFSIQNGTLIVGGATEAGVQGVNKIPEAPRLQRASGIQVTKVRRHHLSPTFLPDQVIPDDLIVQGSACVGLDCVNNEAFGFDTIRMKENNTRLQFDDTSTTAGFPTTNWQIRANSSDSGGESFLGFVDQGTTGNSETGTIVFLVNSGAPANSLRVSGTGRVGLRTATPVLDVHANTSDTPAIRLEQNNTGGFTAQTWDIGANEANFFVRDVTGGSRLSLRIRPGAPTSIFDISATGSVGMGTTTPAFSANAARFLAVDAGTGSFSEIGAGGNQSGTTAVLGTFSFFNSNIVGAEKRNIVITGSNDGAINSGVLQFFTVNAGTIGERMRINRLGQVGIGTTAPTDTLSVNGTASKPGGGTWAVFSDERLKTVKGRFSNGLKAVMQLQPLRFEYKPNNALKLNAPGEHVGFSAQDVEQIIPEAVTKNSQGYLMINNDPIIWTMLNAIKEQQAEIEELRKEVRKLRSTSRRRR